MKDEIEITVNGEKSLVPRDPTVAELIELFEEPEKEIIVEVNRRLVYPDRYGATRVAEGDTVEFIYPSFGG